MGKYIIDECAGLEYKLKGGYFFPTGRVMRNGALTPSELPDDNEPGEEKPTAVWGQRHLRYIRQFHKRLYLDLYISGKLNAYLAEINTQAEDFFLRTVKEMAAREGMTEVLKANNQMTWVQRSNSIRARATEIVNAELIYA